MKFTWFISCWTPIIGVVPIVQFSKNFIEKSEFYKVSSSKWLNNKNFLLSNNLSPKNQYILIFEDKTLKINAKSLLNNEILVDIFVKSITKNYHLKINSNYYLTKKTDDYWWLTNYVKNKFYQEQVSYDFLSSSEYYALFDTRKDYQGKILQNNSIGFRSSWGVPNQNSTNSSLVFNLHEDIIKNYILLHKNINQNEIKINNIEIDYIKPVSLGLVPIIKIISPPFQEMKWTTKQIKFNDFFSQNPINLNEQQNILLPEGHDLGQEWWRGFLDFISLGFGINSALSTFFSNFTMNEIIKIILKNVSIFAGVDYFLDKTNNLLNLENKKIFDKLNYEMMKMKISLIQSKNNHYFYEKFFFNDLWKRCLSIFINGELFGWGKATKLLGLYSEANIYTFWGALSADVAYRIYK